MAFTYGFYNYMEDEDGIPDRRYNAEQMSSLFDGILRDGIFASIGDCFMVKSGTGMIVNVGTGRAWFDHTWSLNDAIMPVTIDQAEVLQPRIDTICIEVDHTLTVRANSIIVVKGTPQSTPRPPSLINEEFKKQYPLADIYVGRQVTTINQADITNRIGYSDTPFVTGVLEVLDAEPLLAQWNDQWHRFYDEQTTTITSNIEEFIANWNRFYDEQTQHMMRTTDQFIIDWQALFDSTELDVRQQAADWKSKWDQWFETETNRTALEMANWRTIRENEFNDWFASLQAMLEPDVAANLAAEILKLKKRIEDLEQFRDNLANYLFIVYPIDDSDGDPILDSVGERLDGRLVLTLKDDEIITG